MQIKEAAAKCGLTEKAIRLYEEKGLISPPYTEINGRKFRDYDDATIEQLQIIAGLRQSFFSLEQIAAMQNTPEDIPAIFSEYRDELRGKFRELEGLVERADAVIPASLTSAEALAEALSGTLPSPPQSEPLPSEPSDNEPYRIRRIETHAVPELRFRVWDEDVGRDAREAAYKRYLEYAKVWEQSYDTELKLDKIRHFWRYPIGRFVGMPLLCIAVLLCYWFFVGWRTRVDITYTGYEITFSEDVWEQSSECIRAQPVGTPIADLDVSDFPQSVESKPIEFRFDGKKIDYLIKPDRFEGYILSEGFGSYNAFHRTHKVDDAVYRMELPGSIHAAAAAVTWPRRASDRAGIAYSYLAERFGAQDGALIFPLMEFRESDANSESYGTENTYIVLGADSPEEAAHIFWDRLWRSWQEQERLNEEWEVTDTLPAES